MKKLSDEELDALEKRIYDRVDSQIKGMTDSAMREGMIRFGLAIAIATIQEIQALDGENRKET